MTVRARLLASYLAFVAALGVLGGWNVWYLRQLGAVAGRIISENYDSVIAAQQMKESLERQDSAAVFLLLGERELALAQYAEHRQRFDAAFERAAHNITEPGESEVIDTIRQGSDLYGTTLQTFLQRPDRADYFTTLKPLFDRVRADADHLLTLNQEAMRIKAARAAALTTRLVLTSAVFAVLLILAAGASALVLSASLVRPLRSLTAATARLAEGDLDATVPIEREDEIGALSASFNRMARSLAELRRSDLGQVLEAKQTMESALHHLQRVDRMKSEFIGAAAHELRTPLTTVKMALNLLIEGSAGDLTPRQLEVARVCRDDADRLERLMNDLLDLSRLESGDRPPQLATVDAGAIIEGVVDSMRWQAENKGVTLRVEAAADVFVNADRSQIERVLTNLIANALRATERGGGIVVGVAANDGQATISVADTGRGIPEEYLTRVFEPFVQVPGAPGGRAGLGLTLSRRIVEAHHGELSARSEPGHGATFTFTLPLVAPGASAHNRENTHAGTGRG